MSYLPLDQMAFRDGPNLDAFGRLRVAQETQLLGMSQEYDFHPLVWDHFTATGGTATHSVNTNSTVLATNATTSGARALRQTKLYHRYVPGKSQFIKLTGTLRKSGTPAGASFSGLGYYDDNNGIYFKSTSAGISIAERTNTSGSVVETSVLQSSWNLDKLDGTGSSGVTIDWSKEQIFLFDLQWLGVGRVRYGVFIGGGIIYCHQSLHANMFSVAYLRTACLPIRYEVFNSGGAGSNVSLEAICASIDSEGGTNPSSFYPFTYSAYISSPLSIDTTLRPLVSRRMRDTFNGLTARGQSFSTDFTLRVGTNDVYWEIQYNPTITLGGGGSTTTANVNATYSQSEYDTYAGASNTLSGGIVLASGFAISGSGSNNIATVYSSPGSSLSLGRTYNNVRDQFTLAARAMSGSASVSVTVNLQEQY